MEESEESICDTEMKLATKDPCLETPALSVKEAAVSSREGLFRVGQKYGQSWKRRKALMVRD